MKKSLLFCILLMIALIIISCGSTPQNGPTSVTQPPQANTLPAHATSEPLLPQTEPTRTAELDPPGTQQPLSYDAKQTDAYESAETAVEEQYGAMPPAEPIVVDANSSTPETMIFDEKEPANSFIDSRDDNLSTFAIDVDTGSYTLMRSYLNDYGQLPSADAIRPEEFINFFDYHYQPPTLPENAFTIHADGAPAPFTENENYRIVRIGLQGYEVPQDQRQDMLLVLVVDESGSMQEGGRIELVKQSLKLLLTSLRPTDRVGIIAYTDDARTVLEPTDVASISKIEKAIDGIYPQNSTNVEAGLREAYRMADRYRLEGQTTRLILLSDGVANVGDTTPETILEHARNGINLSTFGFGMGNYNDFLMEQLADQGDGAYGYIDTLREAQRVFVKGATGTLVTIAKDVKIQVEFNPEVVEQYRLIGYENRAVADQDFRNDTVDAGEVGSGHSVTALYELRLKTEVAPEGVLLTTRVRYQEPNNGEVKEIADEMKVSQLGNSFVESSAEFQLATIVAEYAEVLGESYWARENSLSNVWSEAQRVARLFPQDTNVQEWVRLVEAATSYAKQ